ncbi:peptidoglycan DD-metalloendopeptidase family protein [Paenibacillus sp. GYB004]|uniref:LysM peptidoglycan-binding domain-containing M23 family metallopeptidase n=1 Tax=Paenibacillus sp. GYB004 TaxID=2994393 RepID=UPI002F961E9C
MSSIRKTLTSVNRYKVKIGAIMLVALFIVTAFAIGNRYVETNTRTLYHLMFENQKLGTVSDPVVVQDWINKQLNDYQSQNAGLDVVTNADHIHYAEERVYKGTFDNESAIQELQQKFRLGVQGIEVVVGGKLQGIVRNQQEADLVLNAVKDKYNPTDKKILSVQTLSANPKSISNDTNELQSIEFLQDVTLKPVQTTPEQIIERSELLEKLETGDVQPVKYIVQSGDCISCIASKFNIGRDVIYMNNPWIENDFLNIGEELDLTILQPQLSVKTVEKKIETLEVPFGTVYQQDNTMRAGTSQILVSGRAGVKKITYNLVKVNGLITEEMAVEEEMVQAPVEEVIKQGTKVIPGIGSGSFAWPITSPKLTSEFGKRWGKLHAGTDAVSSDKSIRASDHGKVEFAGTKNGYGNCIIIDHQNGYKTLYAHLSKIEVKDGQVIEKGEKIGVMGSTGNSTGVHLHFEVLKGDQQENPLKYLNK